MAKDKGTMTTSTSEQTLFDVTADANFATWIFLNNMTATETFLIKVYIRDAWDVFMRVVESESLTGVQDPPSIFIPWLPGEAYKVTIQRTAGSDRVINWQRWQIPIT